MTWHCDTHGAVTPDHYGTSYRCPYCTGRAVWRDEEGECLVLLNKVSAALVPRLLHKADQQIARDVIRSIKTPGRRADAGRWG